ncbi:hypothetical protein CANARDRAFT_177680 [[Candida] arabinofermentans NRRL YB-2248]|uniref:Uncharacterized protein n=1 Tax=[Candida] arabinofermentans NRRL YB-2248 TaxID=983967 RepID=A0A1E4SVJ3_9ASCO|nr:hypothetical protein CANARDRAFT_177680 [[Candida] arabinofermentans NRRL YB-2248]
MAAHMNIKLNVERSNQKTTLIVQSCPEASQSKVGYLGEKHEKKLRSKVVWMQIDNARSVTPRVSA